MADEDLEIGKGDETEVEEPLEDAIEGLDGEEK